MRANCLDASALIKLYIEEPGSDILRQYKANEPTCYTPIFCYFEALTQFKVKWLYRKEISQEQYRKATSSLTAWFAHTAKRMPDLDFTDPGIVLEAQSLSKRYSLDLSDAFQILSVKKGFFSSLPGESSTILVTADGDLVKAARNEGIKAWYFMSEAQP